MQFQICNKKKYINTCKKTTVDIDGNNTYQNFLDYTVSVYFLQ